MRRWIHPEQLRYYQADLVQDLFGEWTLVCSWGGLGTTRGNYSHLLWGNLSEQFLGGRAGAIPSGYPAGAGNGTTEHPKRARRGKPWTQPRAILRVTAPVLYPTTHF